MTTHPTDRLVVVGDRFEEFLGNPSTVGATALIQQLHDRPDPDQAPAVVVGQGLTAEQLATIEKLGAGNGADGEENEGVPTRVERQLTHKHDPRNVMVGPPRRLDDADDEFVAALVVDEHNEVLEDHITGQHIPAVALLEAARQLWTVVTEQFLLTEPGQGRFVVISMGGRFHRYVFPLPTTLRFQVKSREATPVGEVFRTRTVVRQNGRDVAEVSSEYRVVPETLAAKQESMAARQAIRVCLAGRR